MPVQEETGRLREPLLVFPKPSNLKPRGDVTTRRNVSPVRSLPDRSNDEIASNSRIPDGPNTEPMPIAQIQYVHLPPERITETRIEYRPEYRPEYIRTPPETVTERIIEHVPYEVHVPVPYPISGPSESSPYERGYVSVQPSERREREPNHRVAPTRKSDPEVEQPAPTRPVQSLPDPVPAKSVVSEPCVPATPEPAPAEAQKKFVEPPAENVTKIIINSPAEKEPESAPHARVTEKFDHEKGKAGRKRKYHHTIGLLEFYQAGRTSTFDKLTPQMQRYYKKEYEEYFGKDSAAKRNKRLVNRTKAIRTKRDSERRDIVPISRKASATV